MVTREQVIEILKRFRENKPAKALENLSNPDAGMRFVLMFLCENPTEVYASTISEKMNISRARVAVLLKKMESKNLVTKKISTKDARIEVVSITQQGKQYIEKEREIAITNIMRVINKIGIDEINHFLDIACKIKNILEE